MPATFISLLAAALITSGLMISVPAPVKAYGSDSWQQTTNTASLSGASGISCFKPPRLGIPGRRAGGGTR